MCFRLGELFSFFCVICFFPFVLHCFFALNDVFNERLCVSVYLFIFNFLNIFYFALCLSIQLNKRSLFVLFRLSIAWSVLSFICCSTKQRVLHTSFPFFSPSHTYPTPSLLPVPWSLSRHEPLISDPVKLRFHKINSPIANCTTSLPSSIIHQPIIILPSILVVPSVPNSEESHCPQDPLPPFQVSLNFPNSSHSRCHCHVHIYYSLSIPLESIDRSIYISFLPPPDPGPVGIRGRNVCFLILSLSSNPGTHHKQACNPHNWSKSYPFLFIHPFLSLRLSEFILLAPYPPSPPTLATDRNLLMHYIISAPHCYLEPPP